LSQVLAILVDSYCNRNDGHLGITISLNAMVAASRPLLLAGPDCLAPRSIAALANTAGQTSVPGAGVLPMLVFNSQKTSRCQHIKPICAED